MSKFSAGADEETVDVIEQVLGEAPEGDEPDTDADDGDDDAPAAAPSKAEAPVARKGGSKWAEKKRERGKLISELRTRAESAERQRTEMEQRFSRELSEMRQAISQRHQPQAPAGPDPLAEAYKDVQAGINQELQLMQNHDTSRGAYDMTRYNQLQDRRVELIMERKLRQQAAQQQPRQQQGLTVEQQVQIARFTNLVAEYPWLNDKASPENARKAGAYKRYLIDVKGRPDSIETDREACAHIAAEFQLGGRPGPSAQDRQRASGLPGGSRPPRAAAKRPGAGADGFDPRMLEGTGLSRNALRGILSEDLED